MTGDADRCMKCGSCMRACPVLGQVGEGVFPGPRSLAVEGVRESRVPRRAMDELLLCSVCHACEEACPVRIGLPEAILHLRELSRGGQALRPGHARMVQNIDRYRLSVEPAGGPVPRSDATSRTCYFPGCIARHRLPAVSASALQLLALFGPAAASPDDLTCCGSPLQKIGDKDRMNGLREENLARLESYESIVASCPGCTAQLGSYGLDVMHMVEYLYEVAGVTRIASMARPKKVKIAVHHPCHLNRLVGPHTRDYMVQILQALPGVKLVEYGDEERCCGAGGSLLSGFPEVADAMGREKCTSALRAGADLIVTACPFCIINLGRSGSIGVQDLGQLVLSSLER